MDFLHTWYVHCYCGDLVWDCSQEADKKVYENIDPKSQKSTALLISLEERTLILLVTNL